jgi:hypothetical protein
MCNPYDTGVRYDGVPVDECRVKVPHHFLAILSVCRLFHIEAPAVLFGKNTFVAGEHPKCTKLFMATLEKGPEYIKLIRKMQFRQLYFHNVANSRQLIERAPNLTRIDLRGFCYLSDKEAAAWKRDVAPGHIVQQHSTIYKKFPILHKAQKYRFHSKGTLITATMEATRRWNVRMRLTSNCTFTY